MQSIAREVQIGPLRLTITEVGATRTVALAGELDLANASELESVIASFESDGAEAIVLDLEALEFIDSTGLALLVTAHKRLDNGRSCLRLVPARAEAVRRVMALTGLDHGLPFVTDGR